MPVMTIDWSQIADISDWTPPKREGIEFICKACCADVKLTKSGNDLITVCHKHPSTMIRDGKVIGTSA